MGKIKGRVLFLDRSDINTDEIIPARYLTEISTRALRSHLLEDLVMDGFSREMVEKSHAIITRANFGCGSSREHAVWALEENNIRVVIAESFARIFKQNMFNRGCLAVEMPEADITEIFESFANQETLISLDPDKKSFTLSCKGLTRDFGFAISDFNMKLFAAGGWLQYAEKHY